MSKNRRVAMSGVVVAQLVMLTGCSNDGDFFPDQINHNEGAVDYRVASIAGNQKRDEDEFEKGLIRLGLPGNAPYVSLGEAGKVHSFARKRTPDYVADAQEELERKEGLKRRLNDVVVTREVAVNAAKRTQAERDTAKTEAKAELDAAQAALESFEARVKDENTDEGKLSPKAQQDRRNELTEKRALEQDQHSEAEAKHQNAQALTKSEEETLANATREYDAAVEVTARARTGLTEAQKKWKEALDEGEEVRESVQSVRVTLKQAYMREFIEAGAVGELAVLMTVKESRTGLGQMEPKAGRVVYYTEGARKNAFMNFRDQPVYGPIRYGGDDLQIRISVIEIDEKDNQTAGGMLKTIATLGSVAYPPSSAVLGMLDEIGQSLLSLNGPDLEWDYMMRLSSRPPSDSGSSAEEHNLWVDAWLRDGYYVLMRSDATKDAERRKRISQTDWASLYLDPRSGTVYKQTQQDPPVYEQYESHSYIVFAVQTGFDSTQLDLAQETAELAAVLEAYGTTSDSLGSAAEAMAKSIQDTIEKTKARKLQLQKDRESK